MEAKRLRSRRGPYSKCLGHLCGCAKCKALDQPELIPELTPVSVVNIFAEDNGLRRLTVASESLTPARSGVQILVPSQLNETGLHHAECSETEMSATEEDGEQSWNAGRIPEDESVQLEDCMDPTEATCAVDVHYTASQSTSLETECLYDSVVLDGLHDVGCHDVFDSEDFEYVEGDSSKSSNAADDNQPLFDGAHISVGAFMLLLSTFITRYNLVGDAVENLLHLISLVLPPANSLCSTLHQYKQYFKTLKNPLQIHYFCPTCMMPIESEIIQTCPNIHCRRIFENDLTYFIEVPLDCQIKNLMKQPQFYTQLQHRFKRHKENDDNLEDVYDGLVYKRHYDNGPLACPDNISFQFNTDGVPVFKSSKVSMWPLYLIINELPYSTRIKRDMMLFGGLWFGANKPTMHTFLRPLVTSLQELEGGIQVYSPDRGEFTCRGILLSTICDLPARALVCNSVQYNGRYGCIKCLQPGETFTVGHGHTHIFKYVEASGEHQADTRNVLPRSDVKGPLRNNSDTRADAITAYRKQTEGSKDYITNGIKGVSWFMCLSSFDLVAGVAIDYMHGVLLGIQKLMLRLLFSSEFSREKFSCHKKVNTVDCRLAKLTPTLNISRLPRSISDELKHWKASEFRAFLLYYGAPVLHGILPVNYFNHYLLLVNGIYLLSQSSISESNLKEAEVMLQEFVRMFKDLYSERFYTLNLHQLLHMVDDVREHGPLFTHNCFHFEDKNGFVLKMIHGTQYIDSQISTAVSFVQKIPQLVSQCLKQGSEELELYHNIISSKPLKRKEKLASDVYVLGTSYSVVLSPLEIDSLLACVDSAPTSTTVQKFSRLNYLGHLIYGTEYKRMKRRNNSVVMCHEQAGHKFFQISHFITYALPCGDNELLAYGTALNCLNFTTKSHIHSVNFTPNKLYINMRHVVSLCMLLEVQDNMYVCELANSFEYD